MTAQSPSVAGFSHADRDHPPVSAARRAVARVLQIEADGLLALLGTLDDSIDQALECLAGATGRVVVTGIGKSGHVARKVAATMASTGSPAIYVHPAEASHGDLGMITLGDAVIALSNSGGTAELADIIAYTRRFRIPLIGITSRRDSVLAKAADVALLLPRVTEACPMGLAPTTSTTMMLALGDALAIALLERRGFSPADFQALHPGGQLGRRLLRVADVMHGRDEVPLVQPDVTTDEAILVMTSKRFGCVGIVDAQGRLIGIVTDGDLRRHMSPDLLRQTVGTIMTRHPKSIRPDALAAEALAEMNITDRPVTSLFVVDGGRPVGIVHVHDLLRAGVG